MERSGKETMPHRDNHRRRVDHVYCLTIGLLVCALLTVPGAVPSIEGLGGSACRGIANAADISAQLSAANDAVAQFRRVTGGFQNRLESVKTQAGGNPCTDLQLQAMQTQILTRYIQAREALFSALAVALPNASAAEYGNLVFAGAEDHADYQALAPDVRADLLQALTAFRDLRYNDTEHNLIGQGCDDDFLDVLTEAEEMVDIGAGAEAAEPRSVAGLLSQWMTPAEKEGAAQVTEPGEPKTEFRMETGSWDAGRFSALLRHFDGAYGRLSDHAMAFADRLDQLSGCCREEMCHDPVLTYSYAGVDESFTDLATAYKRIMAMVLPSNEIDNATSIGLGTKPLPDITDIPLEDQLAVADVLKRYAKAFRLGAVLVNDLSSQAPDCDLEELRDEGLRVAEQGQDPETGLDAGAEPIAGDDGGNGETEPHFKIDGAVYRDEDNVASCSGGTYTLTMTQEPTFPSVIRPTGTYTIQFTVQWSTSGSQVEDVGFGVQVTFLDETQQSEEITTFSGTRTFSFTFYGADLDFTQGAGAISVVIGGGLMCTGGSAGDASTVLVQAYSSHGGN